jgi:hypothetical protein
MVSKREDKKKLVFGFILGRNLPRSNISPFIYTCRSESTLCISNFETYEMTLIILQGDLAHCIKTAIRLTYLQIITDGSEEFSPPGKTG